MATKQGILSEPVLYKNSPLWGGTRQRVCINNPQTWTTVGNTLWERGVGWAEEDKGGKAGTTVIE